MISKGQTFIMFDGSFQFIYELHGFLNSILIREVAIRTIVENFMIGRNDYEEAARIFINTNNHFQYKP
jgi:hypothetical protein